MAHDMDVVLCSPCLDVAQESNPFHVVRLDGQFDSDGNEMWTIMFSASALFVSPDRHGVVVPMDQTDYMFRQMMNQQNRWDLRCEKDLITQQFLIRWKNMWEFAYVC